MITKSGIYAMTIGLMASAGFFVPAGVYDLVESFNNPNQLHLQIDPLHYRDGLIFEKIESNKSIVNVKVAMEVKRADSVICSTIIEPGSKNRNITIDKFTQENCPVFEAGDVVSVTWKLNEPSGAKTSVSQQMVLN